MRVAALVVRICRFFASDALNLLFRANSALLNLLFRDFLDSEPCLQYVPAGCRAQHLGNGLRYTRFLRDD